MARRDDDELRRLLEDVTRRVEALEQAVRRLQGEDASISPTPPARRADRDRAAAARPAVGPVTEEAKQQPARAPSGPAPTPGTPTVPPAPEGRRPEREESGRAGFFDRARIERNIGQIVFAAAGALLAIIGVALFLKLGIERNWFSAPPAVRCISGGVFGAALLGAGEIVRRKLGRAGAEGLFAAGLGVLYVSAYAAYGMYELLAPAVAFALLSAVAATGIGISALSSMVRVAALSLLGGYLAPFLLGPVDPNPLVLPLHLLTLLVIGLALSLWRPAPFRWLRGPVWIATLAIGSLWVLDQARDVPIGATIFLGSIWLAVHGELILSARRAERGGAGEAPSEPRVGRLAWADSRRLVMSITTTGFGAGWGVFALRSQLTTLDDWLAPGAFLVAAVLLGSTQAGTLRLLRDEVTNERERLGAGLLLQAGGLLITAVALALAGWMQAATWLGMALAGCGVARWLRSRSLLIYSGVLMAIGVARILLLDSWGWLAVPLGTTLGLVYSRWMALAVAAAVACGAGAAMVKRRGWGAGQLGSDVLSVASLLVAVLATLHDQARAESMVWAALALGVVATLLAHRVHLRGLGMAALGLVALLGAISVRGVTTGHGQSAALAGLVFSEWSLLALLGAAALVGGAWLHGYLRTERGAGVVTGFGAALVLLSVTHADADPTWVAGAWALFAWVSLFLARTSTRLWAPAVAGLVVLASAVRCAASFMPQWLEHGAAPVAHPGLWISAVVSAALLGGAWIVGRSRLPHRLVGAAMGTGLVLLLATTSLEAARAAELLTQDPTAQRAAVSIWWGLFGSVLIGAGFAARTGWARFAGLALVAAGAAKAVLFDLVDVKAEWRIASFLILGLLMLTVAVAYVALSRALGARGGEDGVVGGGRAN